MRYLEETTNNILRNLIMEMTTDGDKGGGGGDGAGGGDSGPPLNLTPYAHDPYYDPTGRYVDIDSPEGFWEVDWDFPGGMGYGKGFPQQGPNESDTDYEDRVRDFYRDLHDRIGDDDRIFPWGNTDDLIPNPYGKNPPLIPNPAQSAAPGYIDPGGLQPDMLSPSLVGGGGLVGPIGRGIKGIYGGWRGMNPYGQVGLGVGGSIAADDYIPYDVIQDLIDVHWHGFDYGQQKEPSEWDRFLFPDSSNDTPGG